MCFFLFGFNCDICIIHFLTLFTVEKDTNAGCWKRMESYPTDFLVHLSPLVVVQGLGQSIEEFQSQKEDASLNASSVLQGDNAEQLFRNHPQLDETPSIKSLVKLWHKYHTDQIIWDSSALKSESNNFPYRYHFRFVDTHALPQLKNSADSTTIHSNFDEIFSRKWIEKYRNIIPSLFISFYELDGKSTEPQEIEKVDLELISEINALKNQLSKRNIKHLVILSSSASFLTEMSLDERLNLIRKQTGMNNRNCLILLQSSTPKEVGALVQSTLQVVKAAELEFYSGMEKKIRRKRAKTIGNANDDFSKSLIESRYALKLGFINEFKQQYDYAVKSFEIAYENLIQIFETLSLQDPNWSSYRLLVDITIFHIVKLNFYQEATNLSYKKFDVHIQSVVYFLKQKNISPKSYAVCNWLSQQFKWLAQLSDLAPYSLVPTEIPYKPDAKDPFSPLVLPHSGYLYLQAIHLLRRRESSLEDPNSLKDVYFAEVNTDEFDASLKNLLNFAKLAFQKKDNLFPRSVSFINFQLAEELYKAFDFEGAVRFYEQSLEPIKEDEWSYLSSTIYYKLFKCSIELKKHYASIMNLLELCLIPDKQLNQLKLMKIKSLTENQENFKKILEPSTDKVLINVSTDETYDILQSEVLFKSSEFSLSKSAHFQVKLKSNLNQILNKVKFNDLLISFQGSFLPILLKCDTNLPSQNVFAVGDLKHDEDSNYLVGSANLTFSSYEEKILKFEIPAKKIGSNTCVSISSTLEYKDLFEIKLNVPINNKTFQTRHHWFDDEHANRIITNHTPESCEIVPRIPETKVTVAEMNEYAVVGEKFQINLLVDNKDHEVVDLHLEPEAKLGESSLEISCGEGEGNKVEMKSLDTENELKQVLSLIVPNSIDDQSEIVVSIKVTFFVGGDYDVPIVSWLRRKIKVVDPFKISLSFLPRIVDDDIPSLFVVRDNDPKLPKPSRHWLTKVVVVNDLSSDIELIGEELTFVSSNKHLICREIVDKVETSKQGDKMVSDHFIETVIENGHTYRNITFDSMLTLKYKRKDSNAINEYQNKPWKFTLPLLDPRVLLDIETNQDSKDVKLVFMIENPTTRIFSFAVNLVENQNFQITGTKTQNLSVLPYTRQKVEFHAVPLASGWVNLPQLTVYDLSYRVNLPTLLVTDKAQTHNREIFIHIQ